MAASSSNLCFVLSLIIALSFSPIQVSEAGRQLFQTIPSLPTMPAGGLPNLPAALPPLSSIPLPNLPTNLPSLPTLPSNLPSSLPTLPTNLPSLPTLPAVSNVALPPIPTTIPTSLPSIPGAASPP